MNRSINHKSRLKLLEEIAAEYRARGFEVKVQPRLGDLPDFLAAFQPDLMVFGKDETIVVEVKARSDLKNDTVTKGLESALENRPGWRFELIIDGKAAEPHPTLSTGEMRAALEEAMELQERKHPAAALLLLWSATEGALRLRASQENVELESPAPGYVITRLYSLGLLGREQYWTLDKAMRLRNQAAHGFQVSLSPEDLAEMSEVLSELLHEVELEAA